MLLSGSKPARSAPARSPAPSGSRMRTAPALKQMLRELADEGTIKKRRKKLHHAGALPSVVLADITGRDADGELIAVPAEWDEHPGRGAENSGSVRRARRRAGELPGVGDRALLRTEHSSDADDEVRYQGRAIKVIDRARQRVLGIFRRAASTAGGWHGWRPSCHDRQEEFRPRTRDPRRCHRLAPRRATSSPSRSAAAVGSACRPRTSRSGSARLRARRR